MNKSGSSEHRAQVTLLILRSLSSNILLQVILYCLMLSDRHQTAVPNGLLYYMKTGHTESVPEKRNESMSKCVSSDYVLSISLHRSYTEKEQTSALSWKLLGSCLPSGTLTQSAHVPEVSTC